MPVGLSVCCAVRPSAASRVASDVRPPACPAPGVRYRPAGPRSADGARLALQEEDVTPRLAPILMGYAGAQDSRMTPTNFCMCF